MKGPLDGLLVVALEQAVAAPLCTVRLADAGARVIKIERPGGETARHYDRSVHGTSAYFAWLNRGKESIVLDLGEPEDLALVKKMLSRADIFVQNLAPGASARLGIGSAELRTAHPSLITVDIVGYGSETSYRDMRAYDLLVQAEAGLCAVTGTPGSPCKVGVSVADIATGLNAHAAVLEALIERSLSGRGKAIEIAMFDCLADWMSVPLAHFEETGAITPRLGMAHASIYPYASFACADGEVLIAVQNPDEWRRFCECILLMPELTNDARFADNPARVAHREELERLIADVLKRLPCASVIAGLESAKLAWSRMSSVADLSAHPALRRMNVTTPAGFYRAVASPIRGDVEPSYVPALDAHSESIRKDFE